VNLDTLTRDEVAQWKPGERLLLSGKILTGRDAAHKRIVDMLARGETLPVDFTDRVIYYVGPVDAVRDEVVGRAGPTTSTRMDKFTETMLAQTGLIAMIGKAERGPVAIDAIRRHRAAYLIAVGGAAYLVAKAIRRSRVVAFATARMVAGAIHGMSASAMIQPPAPRVAPTPQARLAPMPSSAFAHSTIRRPAPCNAAVSRSPGRTTATASVDAATRCSAAATPSGVPAATPCDACGSGAASLSPPKRTPRPAASRMPTMCIRRFAGQAVGVASATRQPYSVPIRPGRRI
jgi:tartrate/fumarate subfamily iron-sulfur-dependent hydro-lyase beta chain